MNNDAYKANLIMNVTACWPSKTRIGRKVYKLVNLSSAVALPDLTWLQSLKIRKQ